MNVKANPVYTIPFTEGLCRLLQNPSIPCVAENGVWLYDPSCNGYLMDPSITDQQLEMVHEAELFSLKSYRQEGVTLQPGKSASVTLYHPNPAVLQRIAPQLQESWTPFFLQPANDYIPVP